MFGGFQKECWNDESFSSKFVFLCLQEISLTESPTLITLVDCTTATSAGGAADNTICIGYKHQFDLVSERTGEISKLFAVQDGIRAHLVASLDLYEDEEPELLLCYNSECCFRCSFISPTSRSFVFFCWFIMASCFLFTDTCHFQKISDSTSSNEFDFHWNSIPSDIGNFLFFICKRK